MEPLMPEVLLERPTAHVALVTLNRPEVCNAINGALARALEAALLDTEHDSDIRVVVLTGAGGSVFCSGADLKEVAQGNATGCRTEAGGFGGFVHAKRTKPWIAAVEGLALAGGFELALACDMIVASEGGAFGIPEVTLGLVASAGALYRLPKALPKGLALELLLTGERLPSERAAQMGLINRLAPAGEAVRVGLSLAEIIARNAPLAVRETLGVARLAIDHDDAILRRLSEEAQARLELTADFHEGSTAFIEKRRPVWQGR
jgi:enoyl-CoA hydratase